MLYPGAAIAALIAAPLNILDCNGHIILLRLAQYGGALQLYLSELYYGTVGHARHLPEMHYCAKRRARQLADRSLFGRRRRLACVTSGGL